MCACMSTLTDWFHHFIGERWGNFIYLCDRSVGYCTYRNVLRDSKYTQNPHKISNCSRSLANNALLILGSWNNVTFPPAIAVVGVYQSVLPVDTPPPSPPHTLPHIIITMMKTWLQGRPPPSVAPCVHLWRCPWLTVMCARGRLLLLVPILTGMKSSPFHSSMSFFLYVQIRVCIV